MHRIIYRALVNEGWTYDEQGWLALVGQADFEKAARRVEQAIQESLKQLLFNAIYDNIEDLLQDCVGQAQDYPKEPVLNLFDCQELAERIIGYLNKKIK